MFHIDVDNMNVDWARLSRFSFSYIVSLVTYYLKLIYVNIVARLLVRYQSLDKRNIQSHQNWENKPANWENTSLLSISRGNIVPNRSGSYYY